jgi:hypothetical protein
MPGFDRTGPRGLGPMTGGARGFCSATLPRTWSRYSRRAIYPAHPVPWDRMTPEQEFDLLKNQAQALREQLEQIEARIQALENTKRNQA